MSAHLNTDHTGNAPGDYNKETNGAGMNREMTHEEHQTAKAAAHFGYGPLAHANTGSGGERLPAFGGEFQPGLYKGVKERRFANPAPLGLSAFALTTFVLGLINMGTRGLSAPNLVVGIAFGYGGLVQLLAGMWYVTDLRSSKNTEWYLTIFAGRWPSATPLVPLHSPLTAASGFPSPSSSHPAVSRSNLSSKLSAKPTSTTNLVYS
jgi:hypothetical protein